MSGILQYKPTKVETISLIKPPRYYGHHHWSVWPLEESGATKRDFISSSHSLLAQMRIASLPGLPCCLVLAPTALSMFLIGVHKFIIHQYNRAPSPLRVVVREPNLADYFYIRTLFTQNID